MRNSCRSRERLQGSMVNCVVGRLRPVRRPRSRRPIDRSHESSIARHRRADLDLCRCLHDSGRELTAACSAAECSGRRGAACEQWRRLRAARVSSRRTGERRVRRHLRAARTDGRSRASRAERRVHLGARSLDLARECVGVDEGALADSPGRPLQLGRRSLGAGAPPSISLGARPLAVTISAACERRMRARGTRRWRPRCSRSVVFARAHSCPRRRRRRSCVRSRAWSA